MVFFFFFFQAEDGIRDVAVTGVQTCALPISRRSCGCSRSCTTPAKPSYWSPMKPTSRRTPPARSICGTAWSRSEEHTSELQSRLHLVCRLLLEKKKKTKNELTSR